MPLLFCVSICPEASLALILEKSRRCLCVDAHLILAINWQLYPHTSLSGSASRLSICCCEAVGECACVQVGIYLMLHVCVYLCVSGVGGCRKYVICGFVPVDTAAPRGGALSLSL